MKSEEIIYQKVYVSPRRFPTKIIGRAIWILILLEAAKTSSEPNQNPIPNNQVHGDLVKKWSEETQERTKFDHDTLNQEKHDEVTDPTSTVKPV